MRIGIPSEIKNREYRVGLSPASVRELVAHGHQVAVQKDAGVAIGFTNEDYEKAGADIAPDAEKIYAGSDMIVKVKEPQPVELKMLSESLPVL